MAVAITQGMRSTSDYGADQRIYDWDSKITQLYMNSDVPITGMITKGKSEKATDPEFKWFREDFPAQAGALTRTQADMTTAKAEGATTDSATVGAVHSSSNMSTSTDVATIVANSTYYVRMSSANLRYFRPGMIIMLRKSTDPDRLVRGKVLNQVENGINSYVVMLALESDTASTTAEVAEFDRFSIIGDSNAEGSGPPRGIAYDPYSMSNYTQISKTTFEITRTAEKTTLRTEKDILRQKAMVLRDHGIKREKMFLYGIPWKGTGDNGKPERMTGGLLYFMRTYAPQNVNYFPNAYTRAKTADEAIPTPGGYADFARLKQKTWEEGGFDWLSLMFERIFSYGSSMERTAFCGPGVLNALNRLAKFNSEISITPSTTSFGLKVKTWETHFGTVHFKTHPLFKYDPTERYSALILDSSSITRKVIDDTFFKNSTYTDPGRQALDGTFGEFLTEDGLKMTLPESCGLLTGFGMPNVDPLIDA